MKSLKVLALLLVLCTVFSLAACDISTEDTAEFTISIGSGASDGTSSGSGTEDPSDKAAAVSISEFMADNDSFVLRCMNDWVELYNDEDEDVDLAQYYLYKKSEKDKQESLDGYTIEAKGYLVIILTDEIKLRLPKEGDTLVLGYKNVDVDFVTYDDSIGENSWSHDGKCDNATPGFPNTVSGFTEYSATLTLPELYMSEAMSSNKKYAEDDGKFHDFVEIYNNSDKDLDLSNYYLSDKKSEPKKYNLPKVTLKAGEYYLIYCSGMTKEGHAPFKISSKGEKIYLSDGDGFIDFLHVPSDLKQNESYGRNGMELVYMTTPTPRKANEKGYTTALAAPAASVAAGEYDHAVSVELSGEGYVYYTLDGTEPNKNSKLYKEPIKIDNIGTIRAICINGERTSNLVSYTYIINKDHVHPVINVAIKESYLTGEQGIINHVKPEYEHEAYITMMENGVELWSAPCGIKLHGNDSKKEEKQNFQVRFRAKYGLSKLDYKVFDDRDYTVFNSLLLKGGSEDYRSTGFRDELCTTLVDGKTNLSILACRPVVLYLNGQYWGIYWLRERYDTTYCANQLGVSDESINLLHTYGSIQSGSNSEYMKLLKYCRSNDLRDEECYKYVMDRIDAYSLMDWYICRSYVGDMDLANIRFYQSTEDDGKWHWCYFDLDWAFYHNTQICLEKIIKNDTHHDMIIALLKNPEFKDMFIKRYAELMRTCLNEEAILAEMSKYEEWMKPELERNHARYNIKVEKWQTYLDRIRDFVKDGLRQKNVLISIKDYFKLSDSQMEYYFSDLMI